MKQLLHFCFSAVILACWERKNPFDLQRQDPKELTAVKVSTKSVETASEAIYEDGGDNAAGVELAKSDKLG
jgi:hypothetical protein